MYVAHSTNCIQINVTIKVIHFDKLESAFYELYSRVTELKYHFKILQMQNQ